MGTTLSFFQSSGIASLFIVVSSNLVRHGIIASPRYFEIFPRMPYSSTYFFLWIADNRFFLTRGELSCLAPLGHETISAPYFKQCFFRGGLLPPPPHAESNTTPPSPKTERTNILFCILNFASIIKFKIYFL
jgi:hypothetical protein